MEMTLVRTNKLKAFYLDGSEEAAQEAARHLANHGIGCGRVLVALSDWSDGWGVSVDGNYLFFMEPGTLFWLQEGTVCSLKMRYSDDEPTNVCLPASLSFYQDADIPPRYLHSKHGKKTVEFEIDPSGVKTLRDALEGTWAFSIGVEGNAFKVLYDALKEIES